MSWQQRWVSSKTPVVNVSELQQVRVQWNSACFNFFFSWLHRFHSFSVIQISSHLGHLHLLLWKTILNWSRGWDEHPARTEKRPGGLETELLVPLFLAGWRGTLHVTAAPSLSWSHETSSPLPHFCNCWHSSESTESRSFCPWTDVLSELWLQNTGTQRACVFSDLLVIQFFKFYFIFSSLTYAVKW